VQLGTGVQLSVCSQGFCGLQAKMSDTGQAQPVRGKPSGHPVLSFTGTGHMCKLFTGPRAGHHTEHACAHFATDDMDSVV
jgi:hypothetical protein